ncbi:MAG TPA: AtpZ/AtpI family protein, partial [Dehalococcoidia bacterium]|nr:AtpZ/AtpI family protein [Dehalococcoidia bacterium]
MFPSSPVFRLLGLGWFVAISILLGTVGGVWLDDQLSTAPLFTLVGIFLGLGAAFVGAYQMLAETVLRPTGRRGG